MEQLFISSLISLFNGLPKYSPAYMDILKLVIGSVAWIGGLVSFIYIRERKLKAAVSK